VQRCSKRIGTKKGRLGHRSRRPRLRPRSSTHDRERGDGGLWGRSLSLYVWTMRLPRSMSSAHFKGRAVAVRRVSQRARPPSTVTFSMRLTTQPAAHSHRQPTILSVGSSERREGVARSEVPREGRSDSPERGPWRRKASRERRGARAIRPAWRDALASPTPLQRVDFQRVRGPRSMVRLHARWLRCEARKPLG
jgi:hypothetical protein